MTVSPPACTPARLLCALLLCAAASVSRADLPLTVEDLITEQGKMRLDLALAYANASRQGVSAGEPVVVQTGPAAFVLIPTAIGDHLVNTDTLVASLGLRYGLTASTELYARASALTSWQRVSDVAGTSSSRESRWADAWVGVNHQLREDDPGPALLGFAEVALAERHRHDSAHLRSALLGLTTYHAIDPVVLSLTGAYRFNRSRPDGQRSYRPGDLLLLNPAVGFAVNDRVTLSTGLQWTHREADRFDGVAQGIARTATDLTLGVGYGIARGNTLNATLRANVSGAGGAEVRLNWLYTL
jgi:hypothetical protein